jgi:hypothetical protein
MQAGQSHANTSHMMAAALFSRAGALTCEIHCRKCLNMLLLVRLQKKSPDSHTHLHIL